MKRYVIRYRDEHGASPIFSVRVLAYDAEHAEEKFFDAPDADGWEIVSIARERNELRGETRRQEEARHQRDAKLRGVKFLAVGEVEA